MTLAICIQCGGRKFGAFAKCSECGFAPASEEEFAKSMMVTDHYFSREELEQIGNDTKAGNPPKFDQQSVDQTTVELREHGTLRMLGLDSAQSPEKEKRRRKTPWWRVFGFWVAMHKILPQERRTAPSEVKLLSAQIMMQIFPVWAAQGPFKTGKQSAAAMRRAIQASRGPAEVEETQVEIEKHEIAFDAKPEAWERIRTNALQDGDPDLVALGKAVAAAEAVNKEFLEGGGFRLEFTMEGGRTREVYRRIWSDDEIATKKEKDEEMIFSAIGNRIAVDDSPEAIALCQFLEPLCQKIVGRDPDFLALGQIWLALSIPDNEARSAIGGSALQRFEELSEAFFARLEKNRSE
jgi:hypothetical protein